jgi:hypothetical protein
MPHSCKRSLLAWLAFGFVLSNALQVMPGTGNAVSVSRRKQTRLQRLTRKARFSRIF